MTFKQERVSFKSKGLNVVAFLNIPEEMKGNMPALVCVHPGSSCKDQTAGIYAQKMAEEGYVTIAFDATYQGESEGEPRYLEDPSSRVEDISAAVDYLTTLNFVDNERIGVLGLCAGGGYAVNAAMAEKRIKAVGTVVGANLGRVYREIGGNALENLIAVGNQRTIEANGGESLIVNWVPGSKTDLVTAGIEDIDFHEAVDYYRTDRGESCNSPNKLKFTSFGKMLTFDAFHLADVLLTQPLQMVVGDVQGAFGSFRDGQELYEKAASEIKDLYILEGVSHYDLYDRPEPVKAAVEKLVDFYKNNL